MAHLPGPLQPQSPLRNLPATSMKELPSPEPEAEASNEGYPWTQHKVHWQPKTSVSEPGMRHSSKNPSGNHPQSKPATKNDDRYSALTSDLDLTLLPPTIDPAACTLASSSSPSKVADNSEGQPSLSTVTTQSEHNRRLPLYFHRMIYIPVHTHHTRPYLIQFTRTTTRTPPAIQNSPMGSDYILMMDTPGLGKWALRQAIALLNPAWQW